MASNAADVSAAAPSTPELTLRAILLGGAITLVFTAANVYLGLKVGLTFATSIPAAVISMAVLRLFRNSSILENNIVQTVASAAGTLAAIIFVLPGLVMIGWWQGFPYWTTALITLTGGLLGVLFSVPLRRALIVDSPDLPYPEGKAAAEVLRVGSESREGAEESALGLKVLIVNGIVSAAFAALTQTRLVVAEAATWFRVGGGATGISGGLSYALMGVGHLVGISVGMAMALGLVIGWWVLLPILTAQAPMAADAATWAQSVFTANVRFFGAGVIGVAAVWTLLKIAGPVVGGIRSAMAASRARERGESLALGERDLPIAAVGFGSLALLVPIALILWSTIAGGPLESSAPLLIGGALVFVLAIGLMIAAVCGYMAGLIGASNSPISGVGILAIVAASLMLVGLFGRDGGGETTQALVAYALIVTGIVFGVATISNDNLQDLKTGQLVGATPWRQQVALLFGVLFGSIVVPPILNLLGSQLGFAGMPGAGPNALAAPQAALISALARGVLGGDLNWTMIGYGAAAGVALVILDEALGKVKLLRLPPLGVGIGIYLPMAVILPTVTGSIIGWAYDRWAAKQSNPEFAIRLGTLTATGLIVGESLWGVAFAGLVAAAGSDAPIDVTGPLGLGEGYAPIALAGGTILFFALTWWLYRRTMKIVR